MREGNKAKCLSLCDKAERLAGGSLAGVARLRTLAPASPGGALSRTTSDIIRIASNARNACSPRALRGCGTTFFVLMTTGSASCGSVAPSRVAFASLPRRPASSSPPDVPVARWNAP